MMIKSRWICFLWHLTGERKKNNVFWTMRRLHKNTVFLSGAPLSNEITQQRGNECDSRCT